MSQILATMLKIHSGLLVQSGNMNVQNWKQNNKLKQVLQTCLLFLQTKTWVNNVDNSDIKYTIWTSGVPAVKFDFQWIIGIIHLESHSNTYDVTKQWQTCTLVVAVNSDFLSLLC